MRSFIAVKSSSGPTASITSERSGESQSIAANDTMNSRMFATPIGRNCKNPWSNATSDDARLTSWPVCELVVTREVEPLELAEDRGAEVVLHVERDPAAAEPAEVGEHEREHAHRDHQGQPGRERPAGLTPWRPG